MKDIYEIFKSLGYDTPDSIKSYYGNITHWDEWWKGFVDDFHNYTTIGMQRKPIKLKRRTLKMAKKVSEDWANLLLTDKTRISIDEGTDTGIDEQDDSVDNAVNESQVFLSGDDTEQNGGVLGLSKFWKNGNKAIEKAYALGTIAFILQPYKPKLVQNKLVAESVKIKYIKDAKNIYPLSWEDEDISECAFVSNKTIKGDEYIYIQLMVLDNEGYFVENKYFRKNTEGRYMLSDNPTGEVKSYRVPAKPFFIFTTNIENNISDIPMGLSVYANAIDELKLCDVSFDNLFTDFVLGRKKIYMSEDAVSMVSVKTTQTGDDGMPVYESVPDIQDSTERTHFVIVNNSKLPGEKPLFQEHNPKIRVDENKQGIQFALDLLSSKVGFGQGRYKFDGRNVQTATEVRAGNKDLTESVWKQRLVLQDVLTEMTRSILMYAKVMCGRNTNPDAKISINFDDTMFSDEESQRMRDLQEVRDGIMAKWEYRKTWHGENKKTAKEAIAEIQKESTQTGITFEDD